MAQHESRMLAGSPAAAQTSEPGRQKPPSSSSPVVLQPAERVVFGRRGGTVIHTLLNRSSSRRPKKTSPIPRRESPKRGEVRRYIHLGQTGKPQKEPNGRTRASTHARTHAREGRGTVFWSHTAARGWFPKHTYSHSKLILLFSCRMRPGCTTAPAPAPASKQASSRPSYTPPSRQEGKEEKKRGSSGATRFRTTCHPFPSPGPFSLFFRCRPIG